MKRKQRNQDIKRNSWNENNEINFSELYELKSENSLKISPRQIFINETEMKFILDIQFIFEPISVLLKFCTSVYSYIIVRWWQCFLLEQDVIAAYWNTVFEHTPLFCEE